MKRILERIVALEGDERYVVLSPAEVAKIDEAARRIIAKMGFRAPHETVLEGLRRRGYAVDGEVVRVDEASLDRLLSARPRHEEIRRGGPGGVRVGYLANQIYDADADLVRYPMRDDLDRATVVGLSLPEVTRVTALFEPKDLPGFEDVVMLDVMLRRVGPGNFTGEVMNRASIPFIRRMYEIAVGSFEEACSNRMLIHHAFITSPMKYDFETLDLALAALEAGIPVRIGASMNIAGVTAPVTFAGTLALALAENYTGLVLSDLFGETWKPGLAPIVMDQQSGASLYSGPDRALLSLATRDIYRYLGIEMGPLGAVGHLTTSDACKPGILAGIEKAYTAMLNLTAGAPPYISHGGMLGPGGLVGSIEQIVIDAEIISMLNRLVAGMEVNDETLALDLIMEMGFDGNYMEQPHTAAHFRRELWLPRITRRLGPSAWNEEKPDMLEAAKVRVREILASQDPRALDPAREAELDRVVAQAAADVKGEANVVGQRRNRT